MDRPDLWRRLTAEGVGAALLAAVVVGSGIAAQQLSPGQDGLQLLENAAATACGLFAVILLMADVSGAHLNPVVSLVDATFGRISRRDAGAYCGVQALGCVIGCIVANIMFSRPAVEISTHHRASPAHLLAEVIATVGLVSLVFVLAQTGRGHLTAAAVGAYIGAAYFFTSSTSFANPAIVVGRMFTDTFAGIAPSSAPAFIGAELVGGLLGLGLVRALLGDRGAAAGRTSATGSTGPSGSPEMV